MKKPLAWLVVAITFHTAYVMSAGSFEFFIYDLKIDRAEAKQASEFVVCWHIPPNDTLIVLNYSFKVNWHFNNFDEELPVKWLSWRLESISDNQVRFKSSADQMPNNQFYPCVRKASQHVSAMAKLQKSGMESLGPIRDVIYSISS